MMYTDMDINHVCVLYFITNKLPTKQLINESHNQNSHHIRKYTTYIFMFDNGIMYQ